MRWFLRWLDTLSRGWRLAVLLGALAVFGGAGFGAGALADVLIDDPQTRTVTLIVFLLGVAVLLVLTVAGLHPPPAHPYRYWKTEAQFNPANGRAPCALCGYNCIPGGFWTPVPGYLNQVMHTMGCGPTWLGDEQLAEPTHRRAEGGRYEPL